MRRSQCREVLRPFDHRERLEPGRLGGGQRVAKRLQLGRSDWTSWHHRGEHLEPTDRSPAVWKCVQRIEVYPCLTTIVARHGQVEQLSVSHGVRIWPPVSRRQDRKDTPGRIQVATENRHPPSDAEEQGFVRVLEASDQSLQRRWLLQRGGTQCLDLQRPDRVRT